MNIAQSPQTAPTNNETSGPSVQRLTNYQYFKGLLAGAEERTFTLSKHTTVELRRIPNADLIYKDRESEPVVLKGHTSGWSEVCWFLEPHKGRENNPSMSWGQPGNPLKIDDIRSAIEVLEAVLSLKDRSSDLGNASISAGWGRFFRRKSA